MRTLPSLFGITLALSMLFAAVSARPATAKDFLSELRDVDRAEFGRLAETVAGWSGEEEEWATVIADYRQLAAKYPDSIPIQVEQAIAKWTRYSRGMGLALGGGSFIPVFLEFQKLAPDYPKPYIMAARAYIHTSDFEGAKPSLRKATELAPNDPWVDLAWAFWNKRQVNRPEAIEFARAALKKSVGDPRAMSTAIVTIVDNLGIRDEQSAEALVDKIFDVEPDRANILSAADKALQSYHYQSGLMEVVSGMLARLADGKEPTPEIALQIARLTLWGGALSFSDGAQRYDESLARSAAEILEGIQDEPSVLERVWDLKFQIALNERDFAEAERLIEEGENRGLSPKVVGRKKAMLLNAQNKPREVVQLYQRLGLADDNLVIGAKARTGDREWAKEYYLQRIEDDPTNPYKLGDFAGFLLHYFADAEGAIQYGTRAFELLPYPMVQMTLAKAYLAYSGLQLRVGNLDEALRAYDEAKTLHYDEEYIMRACSTLCEPIQASLTAFR